MRISVTSASAGHATFRAWRGFVVAGLIGAAVGCQPASESAPAGPEPDAQATLGDEISQASYSLGYTVAQNMQRQFADSIESEAFMLGFSDGYAGNDPKVSEAEAGTALEALASAQQARMAELSEQERAAGAEFLAENAKREGVVTLPSGLQYEVISSGDAEGPSPEATDMVTTHYHGTLIDGTVFDSSVERGEPASFPLNRVIPGWTEALQLMHVGDKWRIYLPPDLAYGNRAAGAIPANSTLVFEVELLDVEAPEGTADAEPEAG